MLSFRPPVFIDRVGGSVRRAVLPIFPFFLSLVALGCASTDVPTLQQSVYVDALVLDFPYEPTWQAVKSALLDLGYEIRTRDKRGMFEAHSKTKRRLLVPHRTEVTVRLDRVGEVATRVTVEMVHQRYRVSPLTNPDWQLTKLRDEPSQTSALLDAIGERLRMAV